jgi:hypothetical protein
MTTYEQLNFAQIASAIGVDAARITEHEKLFEGAALSYRLDRRRRKRIAPSKLREKLDLIAKNARRLLKSLAVNDPGEAPDGPGNSEILAALMFLGERNEDPVIEATRRIGRLTEIVDGVAAAAELERRAKKADIVVAEIGRLTVPEGNPGDDAVNNWISVMMGLYLRITGRKRDARAVTL